MEQTEPVMLLLPLRAIMSFMQALKLKKTNGSGTRKDKRRTAVSHQVASSQNILKMGSHGVVLHGHEEGVEDNTDGDGQVNKRVHDNQVDDVLELQPLGKTLPDEEGIGKLVPTGRALPLRLLQLCRGRQEERKTKRVRKTKQLGVST